MAIFDASTLELVCEGLGYPEGPIAMPDGSLLLVEIKNECLTRIHADGSREVVVQVPGGPNGAAVGPDGKIYLCNNGGFDWSHPINLPGGQVISTAIYQAKTYEGGSVQTFDPATGRLETIYTGFRVTNDCTGIGPRTPKDITLSSPPDPPLPLRGPDDLVFDGAGGFWFADFGKARQRAKDTTGIFYARADGSWIQEKVFPLDSPNGIALSPKGDRLYTSLTYERKILYWELDGPGSIKPNPATLDGAYVLTDAISGLLDSLKVDEQGNVYVLTMLPTMTPICNGGVTVVSPDGKLLEYFAIAIPAIPGTPPKFVPMPSNICWGGPDRRTAYITCGASDMLVKVRTSIAGLEPAYSIRTSAVGRTISTTPKNRPSGGY